jgi:ribosomal protein S18 acetylase RimI-like enzyme
VSDFPEIVGRDEANRPHREDGPHLKWRDGWALFAVHGTKVPADVIEHPELLTVARIDDERNAEVRRVMVERYDRERYVRDAGFAVLDEEKPNARGFVQKLYRRALGGAAEAFAEVQNDSPEPDGTYRVYFLAVDPDLRPMLGPGRLGNPQELTVHNARASTFGLRGEEFRPTIET